MADPPFQKFTVMYTCHGNSLGVVSWPPAILSSVQIMLRHSSENLIDSVQKYILANASYLPTWWRSERNVGHCVWPATADTANAIASKARQLLFPFISLSENRVDNNGQLTADWLSCVTITS